MLQRHWKIAAGIAGAAIVIGVGVLFAAKDSFLRRMAGQHISALEQHYGLHVGYQSLGLEGLNTVCLRGLTVVPDGRDTLLTLQQLDLKLSLWKLIQGEIWVKTVTLDGLSTNLLKNDSTANYDFLFRGTDSGTQESSDRTANYATRMHTLLSWLYGRVPDNGRISNVCIRERHNTHGVTLRLPELLIENNRFRTHLSITEDSLPTQQWTLSGQLSPSERNIDVCLSADGRQPLRLPYLQRRIGADIRLDTLTCRLTETSGGSSLTQLNGRTHVAGLQVFHPALSPDTVRLDRGTLDCRLNFRPQDIELDSTSTVRFNRLTFHPYLCLTHRSDTRLSSLERWHVRASVNRPWFPSQDLFGSLPKGLFDTLDGIQTEGELAYRGLLDVDFACLDSLKLESELQKKNFRIVRYGNANLSKMNGEFEYTAYENGRPVRTFPIGPSWEHFTPLSQISPLLQMAVMQSEDGAFFYHRGFLIDALREALIEDLKKRKFARGGSTISMQLVKNVFLNRQKNITRKLEEALIVWLIENQGLTSKERMYEVYMNIIEWGPLVYGAAEASHFYFNKRPSELSTEEAIFLASIIPKPKHFRSSFDAEGNLRESLSGYYHLIAGRLAKKGLITEAEAEQIRPVIRVTGPAKDIIARDSVSLTELEIKKPF